MDVLRNRRFDSEGRDLRNRIVDPRPPATAADVWARALAQAEGVATVRLPDGTVAVAELHWYEASGIGRREMRIKRLVH